LGTASLKRLAGHGDDEKGSDDEGDFAHGGF
jgi:hypothetical protein